MKVLVIGGNGSIGRRYCAILRSLKVHYFVFDLDHFPTTNIPSGYDKYIIASPTDTHYHYCKELISMGKQFLCEKPLSKSLEECTDLYNTGYLQGYVVNNWSHLKTVSRFNHIVSITYNYYNTGKDGLFWDCCQAIKMDPNCLLGNSSPIWYLTINGKQAKYSEMEKSYVYMISDFVRDDSECFSLAKLDYGFNMTKAVLERIERENSNRHSS